MKTVRCVLCGRKGQGTSLLCPMCASSEAKKKEDAERKAEWEALQSKDQKPQGKRQHGITTACDWDERTIKIRITSRPNFLGIAPGERVVVMSEAEYEEMAGQTKVFTFGVDGKCLGGLATVVANSQEAAEACLRKELAARGLRQDYMVKEEERELVVPMVVHFDDGDL